MAASFGIFYTVFLLPILGKGLCQFCNLSSIEITQLPTGNTNRGLPEYQVVIANYCRCAQSDVRLQCAGFNTVESIDPTIFRRDGQACIINNGNPINYMTQLTFTYAWKEEYGFAPVSSHISCN